MDAYEVHELRFTQIANVVSAANGLYAQVGPVPGGKLWTFLRGVGYPSVSETQYFWWSVYTPSTIIFPVTLPLSLALTATMPVPLLTEGMELRLFPGEYLRINRAGATAGSTIGIAAQYIESDLPFYRYAEPHLEQIRRRAGELTHQDKSRVFALGGGGGFATAKGPRPKVK